MHLLIFAFLLPPLTYKDYGVRDLSTLFTAIILSFEITFWNVKDKTKPHNDYLLNE